MRPLIRLIVMLFVLTGLACQMQHQGKELPITESLPVPQQLHSLMLQGKIYHGYDKFQRQAECERLKQIYQTTEKWQILWLLVYALNEEFTCYSLEEIIDLLAAMDLAKEPDLPLHWLNKQQIKLHSELLKFQKKSKSLRRQLKSAQLKLKKANAKLEALKAIETGINKKLDEQKTTQ